MQRAEDGCTCFDETLRSCPVHICVCEDPSAESCPVHTVYERVQMLVNRPPPKLYNDKHWIEVTVAPGPHYVFNIPDLNATTFLGTLLPDIFVVRGSQMFRLKWPDLPPKDPKKTSMR